MMLSPMDKIILNDFHSILSHLVKINSASIQAVIPINYYSFSEFSTIQNHQSPRSILKTHSTNNPKP